MRMHTETIQHVGIVIFRKWGQKEITGNERGLARSNENHAPEAEWLITQPASHNWEDLSPPRGPPWWLLWGAQLCSSGLYKISWSTVSISEDCSRFPPKKILLNNSNSVLFHCWQLIALLLTFLKELTEEEHTHSYYCLSNYAKNLPHQAMR